MAMPNPSYETNELTITRTFDAPREMIWKAWSDPEYAKRWWGPKDYTIPEMKIDFRVGGKNLYAMRSPLGEDFWGTGVYKEIVEPELIVVTDSFADAQGNVVAASQYGMEGDWPLELLVTIMFEEQDGKTKMTLRHEGMPTGLARESAMLGWNESFDKLDEILK